MSQLTSIGMASRMVLLAGVIALTGCGGGSSSPAPSSFVPATPPGAALATVKGDTASVGTTFFNVAGQGFVLLSADGEAPVTVMHLASSASGRRVPGSAGFVTLSYDRITAQTLLPVTASTVAGTFQAMAGGQPARIAVAADGTITPGTTDCKLSGKIDLAASFGGAQAVTLLASGCGAAASGTFNGVVFASADTAPAAWQLVAENGISVLDFLAYR